MTTYTNAARVASPQTLEWASTVLQQHKSASIWDDYGFNPELIYQRLKKMGFSQIEVLHQHLPAQVFKAVNQQGQTVVLKTLATRGAHTSLRVRLWQEAELLERLQHPRLVRKLEHGNYGLLSYLVLEYVPGVSFSERIRQGSPMSPNLAASLIADVADALEYLHQHGVVHRDIKPSNLLIDDQGRAKLIDLGLALAPSARRESITLVFGETLLGTPEFMAPEQAINCHAVDGRSDVYALGCTMFYLLTGHPPYPSHSLSEQLLCHQQETAPSLALLRPDLPSYLCEICSHMMAHFPSRRIQTAAEVSDLLRSQL